jgi:DMSO reductase family type II enzyme chaperone
MKATAVERHLARATLYKLLSLSFRYPDEATFATLQNGLPACEVAASVFDKELRADARAFASALDSTSQPEIAGDYARLFTFSASPDCPLNECAYSSRHTYQETQELADIAGFYRAFGVELSAARPDDLAVELEFCSLLALKEAHALEASDRTHARLCRAALRDFLHDHVARWGDNIGRRLQLLAADTPYAACGRLLCAFTAREIEAVKVGDFNPYQEVPNPPEAPEDEECAAAVGADALEIQHLEVPREDFIGELMPVTRQA